MSRKMFMGLFAVAIFAPNPGVVSADQASCIPISIGAQTIDATGSFLNAGQSAIGVSSGGGVEVMAGSIYCMFTLGLSPAGDCDWSLSVDLPDLEYLTSAACLKGPIEPYVKPACQCSDQNEDGHVDLVDAALFQAAIGN